MKLIDALKDEGITSADLFMEVSESVAVGFISSDPFNLLNTKRI